MPYKYYYGKTGRVWNVTKRALGIEMLKTVGNRKRPKRFHIRVEHLRHSDSRKKFLARVRTNDAQKREYRANKDETKFVALKRQPEGPKGGYVLKKRACTKCILCGRLKMQNCDPPFLTTWFSRTFLFSWVERIFSHSFATNIDEATTHPCAKRQASFMT